RDAGSPSSTRRGSSSASSAPCRSGTTAGSGWAFGWCAAWSRRWADTSRWNQRHSEEPPSASSYPCGSSRLPPFRRRALLAIEATMTIRVGISGWRYQPWRGVFYPAGLPQHLELHYAAQRFSSIEINGSFYSLQRPEFFARWHDATPDDFVFAVKGPRFITHMLRLNEPQTPLANFLASGVLNLKRKLGPILWQFPESLRYDRERFATFLALLPRDTAGALALARRRNRELMRGRSRLAIDENRPLRHAVEIRSETFLNN